MSRADTLERPTTEPTDLLVIPPATALAVLTDSEKFDQFYTRVKAEVDAHVPDVTTAKGREAIKALAFKVTKTKTAIDAAGKLLTEEWRVQTAKVDASRKAIRDKLDALRDETRRPVTEWEEAEEARVLRCQAVLAGLKRSAVIGIDDTSELIEARLAEVEAIEITKAEFGETFEFATDTKAQTITALTIGRGRLIKEEADRAELVRLRAENEERERREAAERAAAEEREREAAEARAAAERAEAEERQRAEAAEKVEAERKAREEAATKEAAEAADRRATEAAETARVAAETQAREAQEARDREHADQLARQTRETEAEQAEARRLQEQQAWRDREADDARRASEARAADVAHRSGIMKAAKEAIIEHGVVDEATAKAIVLAIAAGSVPHVTIAF